MIDFIEYILYKIFLMQELFYLFCYSQLLFKAKKNKLVKRRWGPPDFFP